MKEIGKERKIAIAALIVAVLMLTVAFAAMSRTLKINGTAKVDSAAWDIHFKNAELKNKIGDARQVAEPEISEDGINLTLKVGLRKPKDEIEYHVDVVNSGDIDAEIESIQYPTLTEDQAKIIEFEAVYQEDGSEISTKQELKAKDSKKVKIVIRYKDVSDESLLASTSYDIPLTFKINYIQKGFNTESIPEGGEIVDDTSKAVLAYTDVVSADDPTTTSFANSPTDLERGKIENLTFVKTGNSARSGASWDASEAGDGSITGYYTDSDSNGLYEVVIESDSNIYAPVDSTAFFAVMTSLKEINLTNFKTDDTTTMEYMFTDCSLLTNLNLSSFNTSNVINMLGMFSGCESLTNLNVIGWNTSNVTTMVTMFSYCSSLISLDLNSWDTSNVTNMTYMFNNCSLLKNLYISSWNVEKVTNMEIMFENCSSLTNLDLSNWNPKNVTTFEDMFHNCYELVELKLNSAEFNPNANFRNMLYMVSGITIYVKNQAAIDFLSTTNVADAIYKIEPIES